jgi:hypothetical protein
LYTYHLRIETFLETIPVINKTLAGIKLYQLAATTAGNAQSVNDYNYSDNGCCFCQ